MKIFFLFLFLVILGVNVHAAGIGVVPAELNFEIEKGKNQQKELTLYNLENNEMKFEVNSNSDYLQFRHDGHVRPNEDSKITVEVISDNLDEGTYSEYVYVTTSNSASGVKFNLGAAVKTSVHVYDASKPDRLVGILISIAIVVFGVILYFTSTNLNKIFLLIRRAGNYW